MDFRNVLMAIVLSTIVLVVWATLFEAPIVEKQIVENEIKKEEKVSTPSLEEMESSKKISRNEALNSVDRIKLENENIKGSISLEGGIIDDVIFTGKTINASLEALHSCGLGKKIYASFYGR